MIHADLVEGAEAMVRTLRISPESLPELVPLFSVSVALLHRELLMHCLRQEYRQ